MITIKLTETEIEIAKLIAEHRYSTNRADGVPNAKMGNQANDFTDLNGFCGELAFCKAMNLYPDFRIVPGGAGLTDAVLHDGKSVDVKTSKHPKANLIARKIPDDVDLFVLVRGEIPEFDILGYASRAELLALPKKDLGYGLTHFMSADDLHPIEDLLWANAIEALL